MSLPDFTTQAELFSTAGLSASLFAPADRYRLFAKLVYPRLAAARAALEKCYCVENGRVALEPVLMLGISLLQHLDGVPDRLAVELLRYHAGWNFALNRQLGDAVFHPSSLVNFRDRLEEHQQSALGFRIILDALEEAGLVSRQSRQRLDSFQMLGRVAKMSRLDCVRESLRLALEELGGALLGPARPPCWIGLWERYVESQVDYRVGTETLARKLAEAGTDAWRLLEWLGQPEQSSVASGPQVALLRRVFGEQFEVGAAAAAPALKEQKVPVASPELSVSGVAAEGPAAPAPSGADSVAAASASLVAGPQTEPAPPKAEVAQPALVPPQPSGVEDPNRWVPGQPSDQSLPSPAAGPGAEVQPKDKQQLASNRVQNPHEPEATYAVKGQGEKKKEHRGYKIQVAESVCEARLAPGEPTRNFLMGIVTHPAYQSDEQGDRLMEAEQAAMGLDLPPVKYVDGAYVSAQALVEAKAQGRELIGPAQPAPQKDGRFSVEEFQISVEERRAICPGGKVNTQCSRLEEQGTGKVSYRFEFSTHCHDCPLRQRCLGQDQRHRTVVVGQHHSALQARRQEQKTPAFQQRMNHRNGIEGTGSELVRGHGLRHARYRGLAKSKLQNYFIGAACNVKRWIRREVWNLQQAALGLAAPALSAPAN